MCDTLVRLTMSAAHVRSAARRLVLVVWPQETESRYILTILAHRLQEHLGRAQPKTVFAIFLPVDDEFFLDFAATDHSNESVLVALVVSVVS